jgi:hypothetical protein
VTNNAIPNQPFLPVRVPTTIEDLHRNVRALEEYVLQPHRTYGSRLISPLFYADITTGGEAITIRHTGSGSAGSGQWDGVTIDLDRRFRAFVWGTLEIVNTDAATDYHTLFFLPVDYGTQDVGTATRLWTPASATNKRQILTNVRMIDVGIDTKTTVKFQWAVQQDDAANQDATIFKRKMIVAIFDAPDAVTGVPVNWTRFDRTKTAYRSLEIADAF